MAGAYSTELRSRVLAAVEAGESPEAVAQRFAVGRSTAYRWAAAARDEGRREAKRMGGGPPPVIRGEAEAALRRLLAGRDNHLTLASDPGIWPWHLTLAECRDRLAAETGLRVHPWTAGRARRRMGWTWKKRSLHAAEQARADVAAARAAWPTETAEGIGGIAPERLGLLDECGVLTTMARLWGRSPRGTRAYGTVPCGRWRRLTVLGALGIGGMLATMSIEAATRGAVFLAYLEQVLLPEARRTKPEAVLVLDNLRAHKTAAVRSLLDRSGFAYRYLPAHSPDLNPIEPAWATPKAELRRVAARTAEAPHQALGPALDTITAQHAAAFFRHAGYSRPN